MKTITVVLGTDSTLSDYVSFEVNEATVSRLHDLRRTCQDKEMLAAKIHPNDICWHRGSWHQVSDEGLFVLPSGAICVMGLSRSGHRLTSDLLLITDLEERMGMAWSGDSVQFCDDDAWQVYLEDQEA